MAKPNAAKPFEWPPQVAAIHDSLHRHVRYYPEIADAFDGNVVAALVFADMLYLDALRIKAHAGWFAMPDKQLAERLCIGIRSVQSARDLITAQGIELFRTELQGMPAVKHYCANYERIYAWLEARGVCRVQIDAVVESSLPKNVKLDCRKTSSKFPENRMHLQESVQRIFDADDDARKSAFEIRASLEKSGVEGDNLTRLVAQLWRLDGALEYAEWQAARTLEEVKADKSGRIKSVTGLFVTRLRGWYAEKTGNDPKHVDESQLSEVRGILASQEVTMA